MLVLAHGEDSLLTAHLDSSLANLFYLKDFEIILKKSPTQVYSYCLEAQ